MIRIELEDFTLEDLGPGPGPRNTENRRGNGYRSGSFKYVTSVKVTNRRDEGRILDMYTDYPRNNPYMIAFDATDYNGFSLALTDNIALNDGFFRAACKLYLRLFRQDDVWWEFLHRAP